jgi:hypothetical protein
MFPVEPKAGGLEARNAEVDAVVGGGKSSGKIELYIG